MVEITPVEGGNIKRSSSMLAVTIMALGIRRHAPMIPLTALYFACDSLVAIKAIRPRHPTKNIVAFRTVVIVVVLSVRLRQRTHSVDDVAAQHR